MTDPLAAASGSHKFLSEHKLSELLAENLEMAKELARISLELRPPTTGSDYTQRFNAIGRVRILLNKALELERQNEELLALLRELEWSSWVSDYDGGGPGCPCCKNDEIFKKHQPDCRLAIAIGGERWEG